MGDQSRRLWLWKWRICIVLYLSYGSCYFGRNSFSSLTNLAIDSGLAVDQVGLISSSMAVGYSLGKLWATFAVDNISPTVLYPLVVLAVSIINFLFAANTVSFVMVALWFVNGCMHAIAWMPCANLLTRWYAPGERGGWWGLVSTSSTVCASIAQIGFPYLCTAYFNGDWRATMTVIAFFPLVASIMTWFFLAPSPQSVGFKVDYVDEDPSTSDTLSDEPLTVGQRLKDVLLSPGVHMLSFSSLCIYTLRTGANTWLSVYCKSERGFSTVAASGITFWMEVGGIFGSTFSGWLSDRFFEHKRAPVNFIFAVMSGLVLYGFQFLSEGVSMSVAVFLFGFFLYGPQTFLGMHAIELVDNRAVGTVMGYHGLLSGLGAAVGGYPLSRIIFELGWDYYFLTSLFVSVLSAVVILPLWNNTLKTKSD